MSRVPSAPIRRLIQDWMDESEENTQTELGKQLFPDINYRNARQRIYHIFSYPTMDFSLADRIVCHLDRLWLDDPELWAAYNSCNLAELDKTRPLIGEAT